MIPKTTNSDGGKELDSVSDSNQDPVSRTVGSITVDRPIATNWHPYANGTPLFNRLVDKPGTSPVGYLTNGLNTRRCEVTDDRLSLIFSALADPTRRDIVARLAAGDATVNELAEPYDVTVQAVSKHIKVLQDAGLVSRSRDAQRRPCHLEAEVFDLMTKWIERYRREAEDRFRRLDALLERMGEQPATDTQAKEAAS